MNLAVRKSRTGLGAFASAAIKQGGVIVDWSDHPLFEQPPRLLPEWRFTQISPGVLVGPLGPEKYPDTYINHSCDPNAAITFDLPRIWLVAIRNIASGEEVTFDYATLYEKPWSMKCDCGTPACRGTILGERLV